MHVSVIYNENMNCGTVHFSRLESLIKSGLIFAFRRTHEWVIVESDVAGKTGVGPHATDGIMPKDHFSHP